jgi:hypothetical protein
MIDCEGRNRDPFISQPMVSGMMRINHKVQRSIHFGCGSLDEIDPTCGSVPQAGPFEQKEVVVARLDRYHFAGERHPIGKAKRIEPYVGSNVDDARAWKHVAAQHGQLGSLKLAFIKIVTDFE